MSGGSEGGGSAGGGMDGGGAGGGGGGGIQGVSGPVRGADEPGGLYGESECTDTYGGTDGIGGPASNCQGQGQSPAGGVGQYPGESDAERKARLEKTLEESVGGFDEVLADEQREISTVGRNTEGFGGSGGGGSGSGRVGLGKQATGGVEGTGEVGTVAQPQEQREASVGGLSEEEISSRTPEDIPDLVSEDIVAKQLREAALSEDDPALRERLWEEYRLYNDL
jgi:hypothetical protein